MINQEFWRDDLDDREVIVSVKCMTYNHASFIRDALDGFVMQQTSFRFEVIVHDDASTDETPKIIKEYAEKYPSIIKPIFEKENQYSKHDGSLANAIEPYLRGRYLAFCEGDDYWIDPLKLQKQVDFMSLHPEVTMCFHNAFYRYEKGAEPLFANKNNVSDFSLVKEDMEDRFYDLHDTWNKWFHPTASWLIRTEVLHSGLYNTMKKLNSLNGDDCIRYTCAKIGLLYSMSSPMSVYRIHKGGVSQKFSINLENTFHSKYKFAKILGLDNAAELKKLDNEFEKATFDSLKNLLIGKFNYFCNVRLIFKERPDLFFKVIIKFPLLLSMRTLKYLYKVIYK